MNKNDNTINFIEVLRGFAALLVVAYHVAGVLNGTYSFWPTMGSDLFRNGNIGVDVFFVISGFIICYATEKNNKNHKINFILRRFFRIYPLFFICLTIAWVTYDSWYDYSHYLLSATLMQNDYSLKAPFFGYNMLYPAWTIAYEVMFYFLFFIGMCINHKNRLFITTSIILCSIISIQLLSKGELSLSGDFSSYNIKMGIFAPILTLLGSPMLIEFIFGMCFYQIYSKKHFSHNKEISVTFLFLAATSFISIIFLNIPNHGMASKGIVAISIFLSLMISDMFGLKLKSKTTKFLSDISYSLYLTHAMILKYYMIYLKEIGLSEYPKGIISLFTILLVCITIAYIAHITIERYFINLGKKIILKINPL